MILYGEKEGKGLTFTEHLLWVLWAIIIPVF